MPLVFRDPNIVRIGLWFGLTEETKNLLRSLVGDGQHRDTRLTQNLSLGQVRGFLREVGIDNLTSGFGDRFQGKHQEWRCWSRSRSSEAIPDDLEVEKLCR